MFFPGLLNVWISHITCNAEKYIIFDVKANECNNTNTQSLGIHFAHQLWTVVSESDVNLVYLCILGLDKMFCLIFITIIY